MSSSPSEKKSSDVEMGEANSALPTPAMHEDTPTFIAGFLSFKERLSRCSAEKEGGRIQPEVPAILSSPAMSTSAGGNKSPGDATPLAESAMVPVQVPEVSAQPLGSSPTPVPAPKEEKATELMPPPLDRKEIVLGLPASSAAPLTKSRKRTGAATETLKKRRGTADAEGEPSGPLSQHRAKCGSEIERSTRALAESREALKQAEAALKSTEAARAAELSQLEVRVSDLERDLGKSASALFKLKKEKKSKASEVRRLQREIQNRALGLLWARIPSESVDGPLDQFGSLRTVLRPFGVYTISRSSSPGELTRVTAELASELTGAMVELAGRVQPHVSSARRRADRRDG
ncbi:hypothetical protein DY000_02013542 [Brassica cretica]|uniref:Uncharacterized protein n=1 Tax=Brassica cretica TaxID=69181 RepID=A0ABQ7D4Q6_BRACR|nr:hypothetical protein DY000_02013542 [Brassica cretica]